MANKPFVKVGWSIFIFMVTAIIVLTFFRHNENKRVRRELETLQSKLKQNQQVITRHEQSIEELDALIDRNRDFEDKVKALNKTTQNFEQFVVPDPNQIITQAKSVLTLENMDLAYQGYVPAGNHVFVWTLFENKPSEDDDEPSDSAQFEIEGPTKFELELRTSKQKGKSEVDSIELVLNLPNKMNAASKRVSLETPFRAIISDGKRQSRPVGLPRYPNELELYRLNPNRKFRSGFIVDSTKRVYGVTYEDGNTGQIATMARIYSDARHCIKTRTAIKFSSRLGSSLGMTTDHPLAVMDIFEFDPEVPGRLLINKDLDEGLRKRIRGFVQEE